MSARVDLQPIIYTYLKKYQEDPTSRVFAPLAEAYRKAGLIDEAIDIAREGLRIHPNFVGGRVALARAFFDKRQYETVVRELQPVVQDVPDNLIAQRLIAESYLMLGLLAQAISSYKMLLYFSPQDAETAKIVKELESQAYEKGTLVLRTDPAKEDDFSIHSARGAIDSDPEAIKSKKRASLIKRIEALQGLLQKVERYKVAASGPSPGPKYPK